MDFLRLTYFKCVAKHENMTKASKELFVSQPAVSKIIKELELELQTDLFTRKKSGISLNDQGRILLKHCNNILSNYEDAKRELSNSKSNKETNINIELRVGSDLFADIFIDYLRDNSDVQFSINHTKDPLGMYDISINSSFNQTAIKNSKVLVDEKIKIGVAHNHHLASCSSINISQLKNEGFILLNQSKPLRQMVDYYCNYFDFSPKILWETDNSAMIRQMVKEGFAISFIPEISWAKFNDNIVLLDIEELDFKRYISLSWHTDRIIAQSTLKFKNYLIKYFE